MKELEYSSVGRIAADLAAERFSSVELCRHFIDRIEDLDAGLKAFLSLDETAVLNEAQASDHRRAAGALLGPWDGIPVGLKDVIAVAGQPLTCASRLLRDFRSPYDATVVERLRGAGMVPLGRLNMDEFAMGSSTENSAFQPTSNPWDRSRVPGGSSGGSAVAVAAGLAPIALGSDTGGSIRQPASFCGVVGVKPTYGRVSRYGLVAFASSLDQIGPFSRSVEDAARLLEIICGHDRRDSTSLRNEVPAFSGACGRDVSKLRIGVPKEYFGEGLHASVRQAIDEAVQFYAEACAEIVEISLPHTELAIPIYYLIATAEASSNLARYDGVRYGFRPEGVSDPIEMYFETRGAGFGEEVKRRVILGTYVLSSGYYDAYYLRAQKIRTLLRRDFEKAFTKVDAILTPTSPTVAFKQGERTEDPLSMYLADIFTIPANLAGLPGLSLPCGFDEDGLPIGLQLLGAPLQEETILSLAHHYEISHEWAGRHPSF